MNNTYPQSKKLLLFIMALTTFVGISVSELYAAISITPHEVPAFVNAGQEFVKISFKVTNTDPQFAVDNVAFLANLSPSFILKDGPSQSHEVGFSLHYVDGVFSGDSGLIEPKQTVIVSATFSIDSSAEGSTTITGSISGVQENGIHLKDDLKPIVIPILGAPLSLQEILIQAPISSYITTGALSVHFAGGLPDYTVTVTSLATSEKISYSTQTSPYKITDLPVDQAYAVSISDQLGTVVSSLQDIFLPASVNNIILADIVPKAAFYTIEKISDDAGELAVGFRGTASRTFLVTATGISQGAVIKQVNADTDVAGVGSASITGLTAGDYMLTVEDPILNCTVTSLQVVSIPLFEPIIIQQPTIFGETYPQRKDGSIEVSVSGGIGLYTVSAEPVAPLNEQQVVVEGDDQDPIILAPLASGFWSIKARDKNNCSATYPDQFVPTTEELSITVDHTNPTRPTAADGTLTVQVKGGNSKYKITAKSEPAAGEKEQVTTVKGNDIEPSVISRLRGGNYTVTATDVKSGAMTNPVVVYLEPQPDKLIATIKTIHETCVGLKNGSIIVTAKGGTPPYQFSITGDVAENYISNDSASQQFSPLAPEKYSVVVKDSKGQITVVVPAVIAPAKPFRIVTQQTAPSYPYGSDGKITVTAFGGVPPYSYALVSTPSSNLSQDNVIKGLAAGEYKVMAVDVHGCQTTSDVVTIPQADLLTVDSVKVTPISAAGAADATITVDVTGGLPPLLFTFDGVGPCSSPVFKNVGPGMHIITVTDASTPPTKLTITTGIISDPMPLTIKAVTTAATSVSKEAKGRIVVAAQGGTPPYLYSTDGGATFGSSNEFINAPGKYSVVVKDAKGCMAYVIALI